MATKKNEMIKNIITFISTRTHDEVVKGYNSIEPLPRGYKLKKNDAWCASALSDAFWHYNLYFWYECSAEKMRQKCIKDGRYIKGLKGVKVGDVIFYDFNKNGVCNHVGMVSSITKSGIVCVLEGNYRGAIGTRHIMPSYECVLGHGKAYYSKYISKEK